MGEHANDSTDASMRGASQVSVSHIDELVRLAAADPTVYGARLTGGGFGGSIVAIAVQGTGLAAAQRIAAGYQQTTGVVPTVHLPRGAG